MSWTPAQLKAADASLGIADPAEAAAALAQQTATLHNQPFMWADAKRVARESPTGDWARIVMRSRQVASLPPQTPFDAAILAAINAVESADTDVVDPNDPGSWQAWSSGIAALSGVGDLSAGTVAALAALQTRTAPTFTPPPTDQDVTHARSL